MNIYPYDRQKAVDYALRWAMGRNPAYYDFEKIGGDCTNFASQCLYAGSGVMNWTPVSGWYYVSASQRSASWAGVEFLYQFLTENSGRGPYAILADAGSMQPGDLVQLRFHSGEPFMHCPVVLSVQEGNILVAAHTFDAVWRPLSSYSFQQARYLQIEGVRK